MAMIPHSRCLYNPCVCVEGPTQDLTIKVDKTTCKVIEERGGAPGAAARMIAIHHVHPHCPCNPSACPSACPSEPKTKGITVTVEEKTYKVIEQSAGDGLAEDRVSRILAAHARIPEPVPIGSSGYDWMV